jgi:hypothetical protein
MAPRAAIAQHKPSRQLRRLTPTSVRAAAGREVR